MGKVKSKEFKIFWLSMFYGFIILLGIVYSSQIFINDNPKTATWQDVADYNFEVIDQTYGDETEHVQNVYAISTPEQLAGLFSIDQKIASSQQNSAYAEDLSSISNGTYVLANDIDMSGRSWSVALSFSRVFDGNYHTISNLIISKSDTYVGLVGKLTGTIRNLFLENVTVHNNYSGNTTTYTGAIAGYNDGTISNVDIVSGSIKGNVYRSSSSSRYTGGITGYNVGLIKNCYNSSTVSTGTHIGGIAGRNADSITNCFNYSKISDTSSNNAASRYCGGIAGYNAGGSDLSKCYNAGTITNSSTTITRCFAGGIVGYTVTAISECANDGTVSAGTSTSKETNYAGGIAGYSSKSITNCSNSGSITSYAKSTITNKEYNRETSNVNSYDKSFEIGTYRMNAHGALVYIEARVFNNSEYDGDGDTPTANYNSRVTDIKAYAGGIVGYGSATCSSCYNSGSVSGGTSREQHTDVISIGFIEYYNGWFGSVHFVSQMPTYAVFNVSYISGRYYSPINGNRTVSTSRCYSTRDYGTISSSDFSITADFYDFGGETVYRNRTGSQTFTHNRPVGQTSQRNNFTVRFTAKKIVSNDTYILQGYTDLYLYGNGDDASRVGSGKHQGPFYTINESITIKKDYTVSSSVSASNLGSTYWATSSVINGGKPYLKNLYW